MKRTIKTAGILAATLTIAAVSISPASAAGRGAGAGRGTMTPSGVCTATGVQQQGSQAARGGMMGKGRQATRGTMQGQTHVTAPMGTLSAAQKAELVAMVEEEKLAHDVYVAIAAKFPTLTQFANIARSELQHQTALRSLLTRYGITDPTVNLAAGKFVTADMQALYDKFVAQATSTTAAIAVGVQIEKLDIADLTEALSGLTAPDVVQVYTNLRTASQRHLAAFGG